MQSIVAPSGINRRILLSTLAVLPIFQPWAAMAQQAPSAASSAFSFAAVGDTRPMMYLPLKEGQPDLINCLSKCLGWSCPRRLRKR